jgi:hypothetical protein
MFQGIRPSFIIQATAAARKPNLNCRYPGCASHIFPERGHSCPPVGFGVDQRAKADKNVRAPITRANNAGKM